jgi:hypothetical protein
MQKLCETLRRVTDGWAHERQNGNILP